MAADLGYTLQMMLFRGCPVMVHDIHMRRRRLHLIVVGATVSNKLIERAPAKRLEGAKKANCVVKHWFAK